MIKSKNNRPRVALFEPRIPQNTGTIGRSCLAFNLALDIIKPELEPLRLLSSLNNYFIFQKV